jgi:hypothetical protein
VRRVKIAPVRPRLHFSALPAIAAIGAAVGTGLDQLHVRGGAEVYAHASFAGQAWWVPPEFGLAYAAGVYGVTVLGRPQPDARSGRRLLGEVVWLGAIYSLTALIPERTSILMPLLVALALVRAQTLVELVRRNPIPAAMLVVGGPLLEAALSAADLFSYTTTQFLGLPAWLPFLYVHAVPFAIRLTETALQHFGAAPDSVT